MSRRIAAQKASRLAAQQLESSPVPVPDTDHDGETSFGEPSTPRSAVRVTYGSKRKLKQSRAGSSSTSSPTRPRVLSIVESFPNKPPSNGAGSGQLSGQGWDGRDKRNTRAKSTSSHHSVENSSVVISDPEVIVLSKNQQHTQSSRRTTVSGPNIHSVDTKTIKRHSSNGKGLRKRPLSRSSSDVEGNSLTPPSSPERKKKHSFPPTSNIAPRLARQFMRVQSQVSPKTVSEFKHQPITQSKSLDNLFAPLDSTDEESADETDTGSLVWVSIDLDGNLTDCEDGGEDTVWWPAKVELPKPLMRVTLYGHPPGMDGDRRLSINKPSASNVRPMMLDGHIRFNESNHRPSHQDSMHSSPRKKRKLDLVTAWQEARDFMVRANEDGDDALLSSLTRYASGPSRHNGKCAQSIPEDGKGKAKALNETLDLDFVKSGRKWRAPSANPLLELPGELVLARETKGRTQYWPAKLLAYVKPQKESQKPKYKVLFFDGTVSHIEPDWFWTTTDEEFATCKLGESTGNYGLDSDHDVYDAIADTDNFSRPFAPEDEATLRAPSPLPDLPAPSSSTFEYDFTIAEEFEWVKPVLAAVMDDQYEPARARHEGFMRGGGVRQKVLDAVPLCGSLSAKEKEELAYHVRCWARRRDRRCDMGLNVDYPRDKLYPPANRPLGAAATISNGRDSDADSALTPTSDLSVSDTEILAPSQTEAPPSSFGPTEFGTDDEEVVVRQNFSEHESNSPEGAINVSSTDEHPRASEDVSAGAEGSEVMVMKGNSAQVDEALQAAPRMSFHDLDPLEKLTYCDNVLLQEAILQILLWRTGHRTTLGLLFPKEEQRLHDIALEEGEKTNWVHDIIRLRQAAEKTMLPFSKEKGKGNNAAAGTRGRNRRGL